MNSRQVRTSDSATWVDRAAACLGIGCVLSCIAITVWPVFLDLDLYGGHDWDEMSAQRLLTVKALLEFGQAPLWMPYACGGYSAWGNVQGATNLVSPFLPAYLLLDLREALRVELVGTLLISALGTWLLAGEFTRSVAARTFACLVFVVNGRWALQAATGHLWHLQYCYLPWIFWAFERLLRERRLALRPLCIGASAFAALVYTGAIYPLPHAALLLGVYAAIRAIVERDHRPLAALAALGALAVGLSAPKLFAVAIDFVERPRLVSSPEAIDYRILWTALVHRGQMPGSEPIAVPLWGWHEYGMYIGWAPTLLVFSAAIFGPPRGDWALKLTGAIALMLGFGAFHSFAPWTLLHEVGPFRSQHVPTRWLYPAMLLLGVSAAAAFGHGITRFSKGRRLDFVLLAGCFVLAVDIGAEASSPLRHAFWMRAPQIDQAPAFEQREQVPPSLQYERRDYAPEAVPAMLAGTGVLECSTMHPSLNKWAPRDENGRPQGMGARGRESAEYRGEVFTSSGVGTAKVVAFSPNEVVVDVVDARPHDRLILNQNFDPGWSVEGRPTESYRDAIATELLVPTVHLTFRFWPRGLSAGLGVFALTLAALALIHYRRD